jgi:hypothetical protein
LIWPLVVRYFSAAQIKRIAMFVILASPLLRLFLVGHHVNIYSNFFCRLDGLMAGALLVVVLRTKTFKPARYVKLAWASFLLSSQHRRIVPQHRLPHHRDGRFTLSHELVVEFP